MSVRASFEKKFGKANAAAIVAAAEMHENGINSSRKGSDPFKWAILICIGYECMSKYKENHGIDLDVEDVKKWAVKHGKLASHDGDCDYLALMCGAYKGWIAEKAKTKVKQ